MTIRKLALTGLLLAARSGSSFAAPDKVAIGYPPETDFLAVAVAKTVLIMLVFMHLARSMVLPRLIVLAMGVWLLILYGLTAADYFTR